jgi:DNA-binding NarL/FixJ family response regulator
MIRVLLADDQALVRAGFASLLATQDDIEVVGEAADGEEAVRQATALAPDVVLMDIRMPGMDGLAATKAIASDARLSGVRVVILTTFDLDEYVFDAICNGASGFLVKDTEPGELIRAVRVVTAGSALLSPGVTRQLISEFASRAQRPPPRLDNLTEREREITALVAEGLSNDEIAARLPWCSTPETSGSSVSRRSSKCLEGTKRTCRAVPAALRAPCRHPPHRRLDPARGRGRRDAKGDANRLPVPVFPAHPGRLRARVRRAGGPLLQMGVTRVCQT